MTRKSPKCDVYRQRFSVPFEYPVYFTRDVFRVDDPLFESAVTRLGEKRRHRALVYVDAGVAAAHPALIQRIKDYFHARPETLELASSPELIPGGEAAKTSWDRVKDVMWSIGNHHLDRQSFVVAIGGGGVLDMVGFATSLVHRGLRLVRLPTTVLAQNDAGVGVKNGMDEHGAKNYVGTFAPPFAVINDFAFLPTLDDAHWTGGTSEAFKVALIKDAAFFRWLERNAARLKGRPRRGLGAARRRDLPTMETLVRRTAVLHLDHIRTSGDPFEFGAARPLDFGHWAAHQLEAMSGYSVNHGQAVAVGIAVDSFCAMRRKLLTRRALSRILSAMRATGLMTWHPLLKARGDDGVLLVLGGLERFREHLGGTLTVTLPRGIGAKVEVHQVFADVVEEAVVYLKQGQDR